MTEETTKKGEEALAKIGVKLPPSQTQKEAVPSAPEPTDEPNEPAPDEVADEFDEKVARMIQVMDRGILNERLGGILRAATPPGRRGKFVRDNREDIIRYQNLGFTFDVNDDVDGLHAAGDSRVRVGDVVLMTIAEEDYRVLREVKRRRVAKNVEGAGKREYMEVSQNQGTKGVVPFDESETRIGKE